MKTVDDLITDILRREGGYVNHPADRGGPTNRGVTQATLSAWLGRPATLDDVKALDEATARHIYETNYFVKPRLDKLPAEIQAQAFDFAVNAGPPAAVKLLQRALNASGFGPVDVDGVLGPQSCRQAAAAQAEMGPALGDVLACERVNFYRDIVRRRPSQVVFLKGWRNRACEFMSPDIKAIVMAEPLEVV